MKENIEAAEHTKYAQKENDLIFVIGRFIFVHFLNLNVLLMTFGLI